VASIACDSLSEFSSLFSISSVYYSKNTPYFTHHVYTHSFHIQFCPVAETPVYSSRDFSGSLTLSFCNSYHVVSCSCYVGLSSCQSLPIHRLIITSFAAIDLRCDSNSMKTFHLRANLSPSQSNHPPPRGGLEYSSKSLLWQPPSPTHPCCLSTSSPCTQQREQ
jgi:hypothetical protein